MNNTVYIGIDPGWGGAIAILNNGNEQVYKSPETPNAIAELLREIIIPFNRICSICIVVEEVHGRGSKNDVGEYWAAQNTFRFGMSYGAWLGALGALGVSDLFVRLVKPKNWQKLLLGKFPKGNSKVVSLSKAIERHPKLAKKIGKNHNFADALNLADYCKIYYTGKWNMRKYVPTLEDDYIDKKR